MLPQGLHHLDLFLGTAAAVVELLVKGDVFSRVPANTNAESESTLAQHIQAGSLFGNQRGLALRQDEHPGGETKFRCDAGQITEKNEGIMKQILRRITVRVPVGARCNIDAKNVIGGLQKIIACGFQALCIVTRGLWIATDIADRRKRTKLHDQTPI